LKVVTIQKIGSLFVMIVVITFVKNVLVRINAKTARNNQTKPNKNMNEKICICGHESHNNKECFYCDCFVQSTIQFVAPAPEEKKYHCMLCWHECDMRNCRPRCDDGNCPCHSQETSPDDIKFIPNGLKKAKEILEETSQVKRTGFELDNGTFGVSASTHSPATPREEKFVSEQLNQRDAEELKKNGEEIKEAGKDIHSPAPEELKENWEEAFDAGCNTDNISDPPSDKEWIKHFIASQIQKAEERSRKAERERILEWAEGMKWKVPPEMETEQDFIHDRALTDLIARMREEIKQ